jgi:hypothetical protein
MSTVPTKDGTQITTRTGALARPLRFPAADR